MITILIIIVLAVLIVVIASLAVGRSTHEVESARDTEYLELEGDWVRYNVIGGGPPVVLVHGWLSSSAVWDQLAQRLSQRFTVYTLDLPGFGESDKPIDGYGVRYGSRLLYAFCAHFGLTRVSVIGHDIGGDMAMKLASDHPDIAGRIALVATPANEEQIDLPTSLWAATLPVIGPLFYALGKSVRSVRSSWMSAFVSESSDVTDEMIDDAGRSTPAAMSKTLSVSKREIAGGRLARQSRMVRVPVLIITGEEDQIVDPQSAGVWSKSLEQSEVCLMDECGHMPMIERTGEFNAQILAFLTGDARYLEYTEQPNRSAVSASANTDEDTIEVGTLPPEGEDPAFGEDPEPGEKPAFGTGLFSSRGRTEEDANDKTDANEANEEDSPRSRRRRPARNTENWLDEDASSQSEPMSESDETRREDFEVGATGRAPFDEPQLSPETTAKDEVDFSGSSRDDGVTDDTEEDDHPPSVRRFGGGRSSSPNPSAQRRRRPWDFDDDTTEAEDPTYRDPESSDPEDTGFASRFGYDPESSRADFSREGGSSDKSSDEAAPESFEGGYSREGEESPHAEEKPHGESSSEPAEQEERPRVRRIRRSRPDDGSAPEVPEGLFDWGNSLDDFEPVDRSRRRDTGDDEDGNETSEKTGPSGGSASDDASGRNPERDRPNRSGSTEEGEDDYRI